MPDLQGRIALVTGASRGIGRGIATQLAARGATVVVHYVTDGAAADEVVSGIVNAGGQAFAVQAELADPQAIDALFAAIDARAGRLDILVANAGAALYKPFLDLTAADLDRMYAVHGRAAFLCSQHAARRMRAGGRIVYISTTGLDRYVGSNWGSASLASKGTLHGLTHGLARELGPLGITVNAVAPGTTDTDNLRRNSTPEMRNQWAALTALGRLGTPEDIGRAVALLVSDDAGWITGQVLHVDGGLA